MFALIMFGLMTMLFGIAFPPLLFISAILWLSLWMRIRHHLAVSRAREQARIDNRRQKNYDKAVRYFS